jgi:hypothetical protein
LALYMILRLGIEYEKCWSGIEIYYSTVILGLDVDSVDCLGDHMYKRLAGLLLWIRL